MVPCATCVSQWMKSISRAVFARLSNSLSRLKGIRELCFSAGQRELEQGAARLVRRRPQLAAMSIDDGPAYRQPHPCSTGLGGVEGVEDLFEMLAINARPGIAHRHDDT